METLKTKLRLSALVVILIISVLILSAVIYNELQSIHKELTQSTQYQKKIIGIIEKYE